MFIENKKKLQRATIKEKKTKQKKHFQLFNV